MSIGNGDKEGDGDGNKGGQGWRAMKRAMAMAARAIAMATGWRASNSIQGDGKGDSDAMARPPMTTFDVQGGGGQRPPSLGAPGVTLGGQRPGPCCAVP